MFAIVLHDPTCDISRGVFLTPVGLTRLEAKQHFATILKEVKLENGWAYHDAYHALCQAGFTQLPFAELE